MDVPVSLENIPFMWGIAFLLDIVTGFLMFAMVMRRVSPDWAIGSAWWIGWWSWASAFTLVINMVVGTSNPFSYHQIGVFTESMTNIGVLWWVCAMLFKNWFVNHKDWEQIEKLRARIYLRNWMKSIKRKYSNDSE